jgi:hypothetical protein
MENLYGYGFWYNHFESTWYAIPRDNWTQFFMGAEHRENINGLLKSSRIETLIQFINNPDTIVLNQSEDYGNTLTGGFMGE